VTGSHPPGVEPVDLGPAVRAAFTTRRAGSAATAPTQAALRAWAGVPLATVTQVHGRQVVVGSRAGPPREGDAILLTAPGLAAMILTADCAPLLLVDDAVPRPSAPGGSGVLAAAVHVGRRGLLAGIVVQALAELQARGADVGRVRAVIGPGICGRCYEVPAEMAAGAGEIIPEAEGETDLGAPAIDIPAGIRAQLGRLGVARVRTDPRCTFTDPDLFSYRREGSAAGRAGAVIQILGEAGR
jgi:YfiH family protein